MQRTSVLFRRVGIAFIFHTICYVLRGTWPLRTIYLFLPDQTALWYSFLVFIPTSPEFLQILRPLKLTIQRHLLPQTIIKFDGLFHISDSSQKFSKDGEGTARLSIFLEPTYLPSTFCGRRPSRSSSIRSFHLNRFHDKRIGTVRYLPVTARFYEVCVSSLQEDDGTGSSL